MNKKENIKFENDTRNQDSQFINIEKQISQISGFKKLDP